MATSPGSLESKQAQRYPLVVLAALEDLVADDAQPVYFQIMPWWLMLQSCGTLRFADHWGLDPSNVRFEGGMFLAKLTRSKKIGI